MSMAKSFWMIFLSAILSFGFILFGPKTLEKAESKMEDAGYHVVVMEGALAEVTAKDCVGYIIAIKSDDALTAVLFEDAEDAKTFFEKWEPEENQSVKKTGKWVYMGTENALKDFVKVF